jgi:hypothetical protein
MKKNTDQPGETFCICKDDHSWDKTLHKCVEIVDCELEWTVWSSCSK